MLKLFFAGRKGPCASSCDWSRWFSGLFSRLSTDDWFSSWWESGNKFVHLIICLKVLSFCCIFCQNFLMDNFMDFSKWVMDNFNGFLQTKVFNVLINCISIKHYIYFLFSLWSSSFWILKQCYRFWKLWLWSWMIVVRLCWQVCDLEGNPEQQQFWLIERVLSAIYRNICSQELKTKTSCYHPSAVWHPSIVFVSLTISSRALLSSTGFEVLIKAIHYLLFGNPIALPKTRVAVWF